WKPRGSGALTAMFAQVSPPSQQYTPCLQRSLRTCGIGGCSALAEAARPGAVQFQESRRPIGQVALEVVDQDLGVGAAGGFRPFGIARRNRRQHLAMRFQPGIRELVAEIAGIEP